MTKRLSYKRKATLLEEALAHQDLNYAKLKGLLGTMIYIFGTDVMKAVTAFSEEPSTENRDKIRDHLELLFTQINNETGFDPEDPLQEINND